VFHKCNVRTILPNNLAGTTGSPGSDQDFCCSRVVSMTQSRTKSALDFSAVLIAEY
jgi:hypothetical protein